MAFTLTDQLKQQFLTAGGSSLDEVLARQGSLTGEQTFQKALRDYASGNLNAAFQGTQGMGTIAEWLQGPVLGPVDEFGRQNYSTSWNVAQGYGTAAGLQSQLFPTQQQQYDQNFQKALDIYKQTTGQNLTGQGLETVTLHLQKGDSPEQALSNLGNLNWWAKNTTSSGEPLAYAGQVNESGYALQPGESTGNTGTSPTVGGATQTPLTTTDFATAFKQQFQRDPSQDELMQFLQKRTTSRDMTEILGGFAGSAAAPEAGGAPAVAPNTYVAQTGDTLSALAKRYGTTIDALMASNPQIVDPNLIYAGQQYNIPGTAPTSPAGAPAAPGTTPGAPAAPGAPQTGISALEQALLSRLGGEDSELQALRSQLADMFANRPSSLETLKKMEQDSGLVDLKSRYAQIQQQADEIEENLRTLPDRMKERAKDFVVSASQLARMSAAEAKPIAELYAQMNKSLNRINTAIGLTEKTIDRYLDANAEDQAALVEAVKLRIEAGEKDEDAMREAYTDYLNLIKTRESLKPDLEYRDVKLDSGRTQREYFYENDPTNVLYKVDMGSTYKAGEGPGDYGLTSADLGNARGNFFAAFPNKTIADFEALSIEEKLAWAQGGPESDEPDKIPDAKRKDIGSLRALKDAGATREKALQFWTYRGWNADDEEFLKLYPTQTYNSPTTNLFRQYYGI